MDWNKVLLETITFGLGEIPIIGGLLEHIALALWPEEQIDVWGEIKDKVEKLVDKDISKEVYNRVSAELGNRKEKLGLIGSILNFQDALKNNENAKADWLDMNNSFITAGSTFQESGYQVLLLPLFAQFANLHLTIMRIGVKKKWYDVSELQRYIETYINYVDTVYKRGDDQRVKEKKTSYNYINAYRRQMTLDVLNFRDMWKYFNPHLYPKDVKVTIPKDIFYTITEYMSNPYDYDVSYPAPEKKGPALEKIELIWLLDYPDGYNLIQGVMSEYKAGKTAYSGVLDNNGQIPPYNKACDPEADYFCVYKKDVSINQDNPIINVQALYETTGAVYSLSFGFKDGSYTGWIPTPNQTAYPNHILIIPPEGYYLTSIWIPKGQVFYSGAFDVLFGFSLTPKLLTIPDWIKNG